MLEEPDVKVVNILLIHVCPFARSRGVGFQRVVGVRILCL